LYFLLQDINEPCVQLKMKVKSAETGDVEPVSFTASSDKFRVLLNGELVNIYVCSKNYILLYKQFS